MTDTTNIRPIRSNIKIENKEPDQDIINTLQHLTELAKSGELRELVAIAICGNNEILELIEGEVYDPHYMQAQLYHISHRYYREEFLPFFEGEEQ